MHANTKTRLMCDLMGPKLRLLFEGGFYSSVAFIQDFTVSIIMLLPLQLPSLKYFIPVAMQKTLLQ